MMKFYSHLYSYCILWHPPFSYIAKKLDLFTVLHVDLGCSSVQADPNHGRSSFTCWGRGLEYISSILWWPG